MTSSPRARFSQNMWAYWVGVLSAASRQRRRQSEIPWETRSSPGPSIQYSMRLPFASRTGSSSHARWSSSAFASAVPARSTFPSLSTVRACRSAPPPQL